MPLSPHAFVAYDTPDHMHLVPMGDGRVCVLEIEEAAQLLADAVESCHPGKHGGRGAFHSGAGEAAYRSAVAQIMNTNFEEEWRKEEWKRYLHRLWNGGTRRFAGQIMRPVPEAVIMPTGYADEWDIIMPSRQDGRPVLYKVNKNFQKMLKEIIPTPDEKIARKVDIGWRTMERKQKRWLLSHR